MKGGGSKPPEPEADLANTDARDFSTNQAAQVVPIFWGEREVALRWISPLVNQFTREAPAERPGKK